MRAAENDQDAVLYLTAAFIGLRLGELLGLRWEDVDFKADTIRVQRNWTAGREGTPKSGRGSAVPMMEEVAQALARHGRREWFSGDHDLFFCDPIGRHLGYNSLSRRYRVPRYPPGHAVRHGAQAPRPIRLPGAARDGERDAA